MGALRGVRLVVHGPEAPRVLAVDLISTELLMSTPKTVPDAQINARVDHVHERETKFDRELCTGLNDLGVRVIRAVEDGVYVEDGRCWSPHIYH